MIFNGTHLNLWWLPKVHVIRHGELHPEPPLEKGFGPVTRDNVAYALRDIPQGAEVCWDVEGSLVPATLELFPELRYWHPLGDLPEAIQRRLDILRLTKELRPDIDQGFYGIPLRVDSLADAWPREDDLRELTEQQDRAYIVAYPRPGETFVEWQDSLLRRVGMAYVAHTVKPRVLVTNDTGKAAVDPDRFNVMLRTIERLGLDAVYWVSARVESLSWPINWQLWHRV